jgi:two-component system sensor histidine kinase DesK
VPSPFRRILYAGPFTEDENPDAAPIANCGPDAARPFTARRAAQNQGWTYLIGLIFMVYTAQGLGNGDPDGLQFALRVAWFSIICLAYLGVSVVADTSLRFRWGYVIGFFGMIVLTAVYNGWSWIDYGAYLSMVIVSLIPWRLSRWLLLGWNVAVLGVALITLSWTPVMIGLIGVFIGIATGMGIEGGRLRRHLNRAEQRVSTLAVAAERERIARDLHDILGHSLTAISIKSGLAARLAEVDPTAAKAQMAEVEQIARVALGDVRATTSGMREVRLASEIASARSVLLAAGIESTVPSAIPALPDADSELLGYAVREAVTNVVRHAEATRVVITIEDRAVTVADDGVGMPIRRSRGTGLQGLRRRFADAGGNVTVSQRKPRGTVVRAELSTRPGTEPQVARPRATEQVQGQLEGQLQGQVQGQIGGQLA